MCQTNTYRSRMILDSDTSMKTMKWDRIGRGGTCLWVMREDFRDDWGRERGDRKDSPLEGSILSHQGGLSLIIQR